MIWLINIIDLNLLKSIIKRRIIKIKMYLNKICSEIHIIYTFSHILEPLFQDNEIYSNNNFAEFTKFIFKKNYY